MKGFSVFLIFYVLFFPGRWNKSGYCRTRFFLFYLDFYVPFPLFPFFLIEFLYTFPIRTSISFPSFLLSLFYSTGLYFVYFFLFISIPLFVFFHFYSFQVYIPLLRDLGQNFGFLPNFEFWIFFSRQMWVMPNDLFPKGLTKLAS